MFWFRNLIKKAIPATNLLGNFLKVILVYNQLKIFIVAQLVHVCGDLTVVVVAC